MDVLRDYAEREKILTAQTSWAGKEADENRFATDEQVAAIGLTAGARRRTQRLENVLYNLEDEAREPPKSANDFVEAFFASGDAVARCVSHLPSVTFNRCDFLGGRGEK